MKRTLKKCVICIVATTVCVASIWGGHTRLMAKTEKIGNSNGVNESEEFKEKLHVFTSEFRGKDVEISIDTPEEFYKQFEGEVDISEDKLDDVLSKSSDAVILYYVYQQFSNMSKTMDEKSGIIVNGADNENIKSMSTVYYRTKSKTDKKSRTVIENNFGSKMIMTVEDKDENAILGKESWEKVTSWEDCVTKPLGDRMFTYTRDLVVGTRTLVTYKSEFHYTVNKDNVVSRYLKGTGTGCLADLLGCEIEEHISDTIANKSRENIDGYITYTFDGGIPILPLPVTFAYKEKHTMIATIQTSFGDSKQMEHYVNVYKDKEVECDQGIWDMIVAAL